jgi:hypothetical protein
VRSFNIRDLNMIDALLQLGQEQQIPIGIEYIDATAFRSRITLHEQDTTVGKLLDAITHAPGYYWSVQGYVITVSHKGAPKGAQEPPKPPRFRLHYRTRSNITSCKPAVARDALLR